MDISNPQYRESMIAMDGEIVRPRIRTFAQAAALTLKSTALLFKDNALAEYWPTYHTHSFMGEATRGGSGDQVIAGVGFKPALIFLLATTQYGGEAEFSVGFDNGTQHMCIYKQQGGNMFQNVALSVYFEQAAGVEMHAFVSALGADGFTLTWSVVGAPDGTHIVYLCVP